MNTEVPYSGLERFIHRLVFMGKALPSTAIDIENSTYKEAFQGANAANPIFITSLPRAGTTILLEALHLHPDVATHTYRDMPLVMAPMYWDRFSSSFRKTETRHERAHGDGIEIGYDSPEAFEEILWKYFHTDQFKGERIPCLSSLDQNPEALPFFRDHFKKIATLRRPGHADQARYASKNNGNISRIPLLQKMFPDGTFVIPFRDPLEHAASLHRQHISLGKLQTESKFAKRYMADIGHFEFGPLHKPIAFTGMNTVCELYDPSNLNYWLGYWICAFEHLVNAGDDHTLYVSFEELGRRPQDIYTSLTAKLGLSEGSAIAAGVEKFKAPPSPRVSDKAFDASMVSKATSIHNKLNTLSIS